MARKRRLSVLGQFLATVEGAGLFPYGGRVLVAVSGGADSMCLLDLLRTVVPRWNLELSGFHMNHGLRQTAKRDEDFVRRVFTDAGIRFVVVHSDVAGYARRHRVGLEEAGRVLRYRNLERVAHRFECNRIALGHTADDNLETTLLNLTRGTGPHGLAGIPLRRGKVVRPLIDIERERIVRYLRARGIAWVEDETNKEARYKRNLVRHEALVSLRKINPAVVANARRTARLLDAENAYLDALAAQALDMVAVQGRRTLIDIGRFNLYNLVLKRRMVKQFLPGLDSEGIDRVIEFCGSHSTGCLVVKKSVRLHRRNNMLEVVSRKRNG